VKVASSSLGDGKMVYLDQVVVEVTSESKDRPGFKIYYTIDGEKCVLCMCVCMCFSMCSKSGCENVFVYVFVFVF
jgi:hypothetical protein